MMDQKLLREARNLGDAEKLELAQTLLSSVQFDELPVTSQEAVLVDERLAARSANPHEKISSQEVWERIERQYP